MALKAGYQGLKKAFKQSIESFMANMSDALIIKSLDDTLELSDEGELSIDIDSTPTENSGNPVTSGGVYEALQGASAYTLEQIYYDSGDPATMNTNVSISAGKHFSDYDAILIGYGQPSDGGIAQSISQRIILVADPVFNTVKKCSFGDYGQRSMTISFDFEHDTFNYVSTANNEQAGYKPNVYELCGIKF